MISESMSLHIAADLRGEAEKRHGGNYDIVVTVRLRGDGPAESIMKVIKKRRPRRRKEVDARQAEMFETI